MSKAGNEEVRESLRRTALLSHPGTAYRNCPASLAGEMFLFAKVIRGLEPLRDFRPAVLGGRKRPSRQLILEVLENDQQLTEAQSSGAMPLLMEDNTTWLRAFDDGEHPVVWARNVQLADLAGKGVLIPVQKHR